MGMDISFTLSLRTQGDLHLGPMPLTKTDPLFRKLYLSRSNLLKCSKKGVKERQSSLKVDLLKVPKKAFQDIT